MVEPSNTRFSIFAVLWALAICAFHAQARCWIQPDFRTLSLVFALLILLKPSSVKLFCLMILCQLITIFGDLPDSINSNRILQFFVALTILSSLPFVLPFGSDRRLSGRTLLNTFQPLVRLEVLTVYFFAVWHKLNYDFLDPATSWSVKCYPTFRERMAWVIPLPAPDNIGHLIICVTLLTEFSIFLLLLFSQTRRFGIILGMSFHFLLGVSGFYAFSATMVALLFLFSSDDVSDRIALWSRGNKARYLQILRWCMVLVMLLSFIACVVVLWSTPDDQEVERFSNMAGQVLPDNVIDSKWFATAIQIFVQANQAWASRSEELFNFFWLVGAVPLIAFVWILLRTRPREESLSSFVIPSRLVLLLLPILVVFNGLCPYLGLKSYYSFEMFSNLQTAGQRTNHVILRRTIPIANYQTDLVRVLDSSDEVLKKYSGKVMPFVTLRRMVAERFAQGNSDMMITYVRGGVVRSVGAAEVDPELSEPLNFFERKLLRFSPIPGDLEDASVAIPQTEFDSPNEDISN